MYLVTKTYGHDLGLSACFRQWRAKSHCRFLHGYPLSFKLTFAANALDQNNWVIDFGGLKQVKAWLCETFDHRLLVAEDDPAKDILISLDGIVGEPLCGEPNCVLEEHQLGQATKLADVLIVPTVGCEGFAKHVFDHVDEWLSIKYPDSFVRRGLRLVEVEVREHGGNSAIYRKDEA